MTATKAAAISVCIESHTGHLADGTPYVVNRGDRLRSDREEVSKCPMFFVDDGMPLIAFEREEPEPEPRLTPASPKRLRTFRTKRDGQVVLEESFPWQREPRKLTVTLHEGAVFREDQVEWWPLLTKRQVRDLFEEVAT